MGTKSNRTPNAFGGASTTTVSDPVYPLPAVSTKINATLSPLRIALAVAPLPPPPLKVTAGSLVYPDPPEVTVIPVTYPAVTVAIAVAGSPASNRPKEATIMRRTRHPFIIPQSASELALESNNKGKIADQEGV